jgi:hypothetical protein
MPASIYEDKMPDFNIDAYRTLLRDFKEAGYFFWKFPGIKDSHNSEPIATLRHDLDFSLTAALTIADVDLGEGILSTFFIQLRCPLYNVLSKPGYDIIENIHKKGHDIALHIDLSLYGGGSLDGVQDELQILASYFPFINKDIVSIHRPGDLQSIKEFHFPYPRHTYEREFAEDMQYISDSRGVWRNGDPRASSAFKMRKPIQLATHPLWWVADGSTPKEKLANFAIRRKEETATLLKQAISFV